jgi:hypothetical protein
MDRLCAADVVVVGGFAACMNHEIVVDEIEQDLDCSGSIRDRECRKPARRDVERDLPPVIDCWAVGKPDLADDLSPHMQRLIRVLPLLIRQARPGFLDASPPGMPAP